jgi:hypothetical protein
MKLMYVKVNSGCRPKLQVKSLDSSVAAQEEDFSPSFPLLKQSNNWNKIEHPLTDYFQKFFSSIIFTF